VLRTLCQVWILAVSASVVSVTIAVAAPPAADQLLPSMTKGYISISNVHELLEKWDQTQLGQLMNDPVMEPFAEDLRRQLKEAWTKAHRELGIEWDDIKELPTGEVAAAVVYPDGGEPAFAVLADVTDNRAKADEFLERAAKLLLDEGARRSEQESLGTKLTVFEIPAGEDGDEPPRVAIYFIKDEMLCVTSHMALAKQLLERFDGESDGRLADHGPYQSVMNRCSAEAAELVPQVKWFVEPIAYAEALRWTADRAGIIEDEKKKPTREGADGLTILKRQGFDGILGIGGFLNLMADRYEILHRTAIYAPGPHKKSMRMLVFPNGGDLSPQLWVPPDVASYITFNMDILEAFDNFGPFFDEVIAGNEEGEESVWEEALENMKEDPFGPQIDLREDLVRHLGQRVTLITDYLLPITPTSERLLLAIEAKDEAALAAVVKKSMETDDEIVRREFKNHVIWEVVEQQAPVDEFEALDVDLPDGEDALGRGDDRDDIPVEGERLLPHSAFCVAQGHLYVASHVDFLEKILTTADGGRTLGDAIEYKLVAKEIDELVHTEMSFRIFIRTDEAFRPTYELMRSGRMPESETMFGRLLNALLGDNDETELREQFIDASKLPDFQVVRRYLGPAGVCITTEENFGWFISGFLLNKQVAP